MHLELEHRRERVPLRLSDACQPVWPRQQLARAHSGGDGTSSHARSGGSPARLLAHPR